MRPYRVNEHRTSFIISLTKYPPMFLSQFDLILVLSIEMIPLALGGCLVVLLYKEGIIEARWESALIEPKYPFRQCCGCADIRRGPRKPYAFTTRPPVASPRSSQLEAQLLLSSFFFSPYLA